jgi:hypothetical protein
VIMLPSVTWYNLYAPLLLHFLTVWPVTNKSLPTIGLRLNGNAVPPSSTLNELCLFPRC